MTKSDFDEFDDLNDEQEDLTFAELDVEKIKSKIPTFTSAKLCEMIVCDRYFGCYNELALACMEELAQRRIAGDDFDFESHIDNSYNQLPKLEVNLPNLSDVLRTMIGRKFVP